MKYSMYKIIAMIAIIIAFMAFVPDLEAKRLPKQKQNNLFAQQDTTIPFVRPEHIYPLPTPDSQLLVPLPDSALSEYLAIPQAFGQDNAIIDRMPTINLNPDIEYRMPVYPPEKGRKYFIQSFDPTKKKK